MRPAAILFDLDGTLAESFAAIRTALNFGLAAHGLPERDLAWVSTHVGRGAAVLVGEAVGADSDEALRRSVGAAFGARYREIYLEGTPPMPGAADVLAFVSARVPGRVAVVSNKYEELCRGWLARWGLARFVAAVVGSDTYAVRKPDPAVIAPVLQSFAVAPADALMVGDMEVDVATANGAGVPVVAVQPDPAQARALAAAGAAAVLSSLAELPAWLSANGAGWGYHSPEGSPG